MIERFFAENTRKRIRRGAFKNLAKLEAAIHDYLAKHNQNPVPFVWTATAKAIIKKHCPCQAKTRNRQGGNQVLESEH